MFFVVFCDVWCSTVPESWLNTKNTTLRWPSKNENPTTAAIKQFKPKKDWQTMNYSRLLGPYKTYDIARAVEIAAVDLSTSDEAAMSRLQDGQTLGTKRERKRPGRFLDQESNRASSSDDDSRDMQNDEETTPKHQFHYDSGNDSSKEVEKTQELDYGTFFKNHPQYSTKPNSKNINVRKIEKITHPIIKSKTSQSIDKTKEPVIVTEMAKDPGTLTPVDETIDKTIEINIENGIHHQSQSQGAISKSPEPSLPMNDTETLTTEILKLDCSPNCCVACSLKLNTLVRLVNTLIMNQEHITTHPSEPSRSSRPTHQNLLPTFPLTKLSQLEKLNTTLKDNNTACTQYIDIINVRRDQDAKKHTRNVLSYIITDEFARPLSWTGQKKTIKVKDMKFVEILIETITQNNHASSHGMIESTIKSWLQHSGDRIDYRSGNKTKDK